jgi:hypothetical protein
MKKKKIRKKPLGSGLLEDARKAINKRQAALDAAAADEKSLDIGGGFKGVHGKREKKRWKEGK